MMPNFHLCTFSASIKTIVVYYTAAMRSSSNRPGRQQDSGWSYLVCACAMFAQAVNMGLVINFGVLFPVIIKRFNASRQETGM